MLDLDYNFWEYKMSKKITIDGIKLNLVDVKSEEITNPHSGESCILVPEAIALYDYIKGCEHLGEHSKLSRGLSIFAKHWPKEYMILLD